ncbi:hypothetical protein R1flu_006922 [Riccia fluitans]|uniref:Glycosyltransferases n=1 Tax=Riccia fluitans TaxID=41844 RepID=A0ABD1YXL0_9MARC
MKFAGQRLSPGHRAGRKGNSPEKSTDATLRSASSVFRLLLHSFFCIVSLLLGFRLSRESLMLAVSVRNSVNDLGSSTMPAFQSEFPVAFPMAINHTHVKLVQEEFPSDLDPVKQILDEGEKSSRVSVGRHQILIRELPYPDPAEVMKAHLILARVQQEQRRIYGQVERRQPLIVITPTYRRAFQMLHLSSLKHTLMLVHAQLTWIVIEAGGRSTETAAIISDSGFKVYHLHLAQPMPPEWSKRLHMEALLRLRGLRFIREKKLDGVVIFADESNSHRVELFDEAQRVQWFGALSIGLLMPPKRYERGKSPLRWDILDFKARPLFLPVQGPACNESGYLVGWYYEYGSLAPKGNGSRTSGGFEWAGFAFNAAVLYDSVNKPSWIRDWDEWANEDDELRSPTVMVSDEKFIEPLGDCGRNVLVWWARSEARSDSKYPEGWVLSEQLEVVVPAKRTPWPDPPPPVAPPPPAAINASLGQGSHEKKRQGKRRNQVKRNSKKQDP